MFRGAVQRGQHDHVSLLRNRGRALLVGAIVSAGVLAYLVRDHGGAGHATGFVIQLLGFSALLISVLLGTPRRSRPVGTRAPAGQAAQESSPVTAGP
jgi:hypothetical protein